MNSKLTIYGGDCVEIMRTLPDECANCCVTSPPYFGLRDYGVPGQIGLEETPDEYVEKLVEVFRELRRVLTHDGTLWLNLGDSYANDGKWGGQTGGKHARVLHGTPVGRNKRYTGLKAKDLIGIPWRVAFALQKDGWWLRCDIIWNKTSGMPENVADRPTRMHEYLFLLSKSAVYHYDHKAILEPCKSGPSDLKKMRERQERMGGKHKTLDDPRNKASRATNIGRRRAVGNPDGRNARSVWNLAPARSRGEHLATFPTSLVKPCILAGCPAGGVVIDPFFGTGTTGLVALRNGCSCIGIELKPRYVQIAKRRLAQKTLAFA